MDQRAAIKRARIALGFLFISDVLLSGNKVVKTCYKNGLEDVGSIRISLAKIMPSKKGTDVWKIFVKKS